MALMYGGGPNLVPVHDLSTATSWYIDKLGMRRVEVELDNGQDCVALGFTREGSDLVLGPPDMVSSEELIPILFTTNIRKAREFLTTRGVSVTEIQQDRQGTNFFEMHDLEGNEIEITEEPA